VRGRFAGGARRPQWPGGRRCRRRHAYPARGRRHVRVRLDGIDAPELGQPYGKSARRSLAQICRGKAATAVERGKDDEGRILASVRCGEVDANAEQVRRGMAWVHLRYVPFGSPLYEAETNARLQKVGLWRGKEPVPPWEWRARQTKKEKS